MDMAISKMPWYINAKWEYDIAKTRTRKKKVGWQRGRRADENAERGRERGGEREG